jgi:hypothetical protein
MTKPPGSLIISPSRQRLGSQRDARYGMFRAVLARTITALPRRVPHPFSHDPLDHARRNGVAVRIDAAPLDFDLSPPRLGAPNEPKRK